MTESTSEKHEDDSKRSRSVFFAKWFSGGLGYQVQKTAHVPEYSVLLALPPSAARPENHHVLENSWFVLPWYYQKTTWPKNHFGITFSDDDNESGIR